jgi:hypothetical protein
MNSCFNKPKSNIIFLLTSGTKLAEILETNFSTSARRGGRGSVQFIPKRQNVFPGRDLIGARLLGMVSNNGAETHRDGQIDSDVYIYIYTPGKREIDILYRVRFDETEN